MWQYIQNTHINQEPRAALSGRDPLGGLRQERHTTMRPLPGIPQHVTGHVRAGTEGPPSSQRAAHAPREDARLSRWPWLPPPPHVLSTKSEHA